MMQLRVWLLDSEPEVWRRLLVDPRLTLDQLHTALQHAFGWTNSHLHQFHGRDGTRYSTPAPRGLAFDLGRSDRTIDERRVSLADVLDRPKKTIAYEYDFGDSWIHAVRFEKLVESTTVAYAPEAFIAAGKGFSSGKARAAICLTGQRSGPPEDCGGLGGYQHLLEIKANASKANAKLSADEREMLGWLGDWNPDAFDLAEVNQRLGRMRVKKARAR